MRTPSGPELTHPFEAQLLAKHLSAREALGPRTLGGLAVLGALLFAVSWMFTKQFLPVLTMVSPLLYLFSTIDRNLLMFKGIGSPEMVSVSDVDALAVPDDELPVYTVLLPVYHEPEIVQNLLRGIGNLDYPVDRLEVLLLTEEDDTTTRQALLSTHIQPARIVIVPEHAPKTKPAACNYGRVCCTNR